MRKYRERILNFPGLPLLMPAAAGIFVLSQDPGDCIPERGLIFLF